MIRKFLAAVALTAMFSFAAAHASYTLIDVSANPGGWNSLTSGLTVTSTTDLGSLPDFGATGINGPLTSAGSGNIPAGVIPANITITTSGVAPDQPHLFGLGPSIGAGNPVNAILVNNFNNAMVIDFTDSVLAFEFSYVSWLGSGPITMEVINDLNQTTFYNGLLAPITGGNRYGILGTGGDKIKSIRLRDLGSGFEGITGSFSTFAVPEPGSFVFLLSGLAICGMRRRTTR